MSGNAGFVGAGQDAPVPPAARAELLDLLWTGTDPFVGFPQDDVQPDMQGWTSDHRFLAESVAQIRPRVVVEIGAWKGMSVLTLAGALRDNNVDGVVIAVDTWLGSAEHWLNPDWRADLRLRQGYPTLQRTFMRNVIEAGLQDFVLPLPVDSLNAAALLGTLRIAPSIIHIDAGHDFASVTSDLAAWWPILKRGGVLIGDDYHPEAEPGQGWPGVRRAFNAFFGANDLLPLEAAGGKCRVWKH